MRSCWGTLFQKPQLAAESYRHLHTRVRSFFTRSRGRGRADGRPPFTRCPNPARLVWCRAWAIATGATICTQSKLPRPDFLGFIAPRPAIALLDTLGEIE